MKICQEFNDRYGQASTYVQFGNIAFIERDFAESFRAYSLALEIWFQYNDEYSAKIAIGNLFRLFTAWEPPAGDIARLESSDEVKEIIQTILEKSREK